MFKRFKRPKYTNIDVWELGLKFSLLWMDRGVLVWRLNTGAEYATACFYNERDTRRHRYK